MYMYPNFIDVKFHAGLFAILILNWPKNYFLDLRLWLQAARFSVQTHEYPSSSSAVHKDA